MAWKKISLVDEVIYLNDDKQALIHELKISITNKISFALKPYRHQTQIFLNLLKNNNLEYDKNHEYYEIEVDFLVWTNLFHTLKSMDKSLEEIAEELPQIIDDLYYKSFFTTTFVGYYFHECVSSRLSPAPDESLKVDEAICDTWELIPYELTAPPQSPLF